jgi:hypothetical protein
MGIITVTATTTKIRSDRRTNDLEVGFDSERDGVGSRFGRREPNPPLRRATRRNVFVAARIPALKILIPKAWYNHHSARWQNEFSVKAYVIEIKGICCRRRVNDAELQELPKLCRT